VLMSSIGFGRFRSLFASSVSLDGLKIYAALFPRTYEKFFSRETENRYPHF